MTRKETLLSLEEQIPWFECNATKDIADMVGYNAAQIATYYMLRLRCWMNGSLPDEMRKLIMWVNNAVTAEDVQFVLEEHYVKTAEGHWICPALEQIREGALERMAQKSARGKKAVAERERRKAERDSIARSSNDHQAMNSSYPLQHSTNTVPKKTLPTANESTANQRTVPQNPSSGPHVSELSSGEPVSEGSSRPEIQPGLRGDKTPPRVPLAPSQTEVQEDCPLTPEQQLCELERLWANTPGNTPEDKALRAQRRLDFMQFRRELRGPSQLAA